MIVDAVLQRDRAARLVQAGAHGGGVLGLGETIDALVTRTWRVDAGGNEHTAALRRVAGRAVADRLLLLAADREASPEVRAMAELKIGQYRAVAAQRARLGTDASRAHWNAVAGDFSRWIERRELPQPTAALRAPPGDPFGIEP